MNIQWIRMKGVVRELHGIRTQLERIADCMEMELAQNGVNMRPPKADTSGPEPTITYVDEEMDWLRESVDRYKREDEALVKEDGE
jgi:hypothetical protein